MNQSMEELWGSSHISAGHADYLESLYETYLADPKAYLQNGSIFLKTYPLNQIQMVMFHINQLLRNLKIYLVVLY